jgi:cob(I)alamin adenosyltransferase
MSIATRRGDSGQTDLVGRIRVSKSDARVETYGTVDEVASQIGFARSICEDGEVGALCKDLQRDLFKVGSAIATPPASKVPAPEIDAAMLGRLDAEVARIEALPGIVGDWTLPGDLAPAAALDVARTTCRRAERAAVRLRESGEALPDAVLTYLNRLSDLLWLMSRLLEVRAGIDSRLRPSDKPGKPWSRAW